MRTTYNDPELNSYCKTLFDVSYYVVTVIVFFICYFNEEYTAAFIVAGVMILLRVLVMCLNKHLKKKQWRPSRLPRRTNQSAPTSMYTISSSVPLAPPPPRPRLPPRHVPRMSPPPSTGQLTPPTPPTNRPVRQGSPSLSEQLSQAFYSQSSSFSSPYITSNRRLTDMNNTIPSFSPWPSSTYSSSVASFPSDYSHSNFTEHVDRVAATRIAANLQPPAYPDVVEENPLPPPHINTTPSTDEESEKVFGPSTDGLPSYEAAVSTWQPPVYTEHPTPQDSLPMTND